MIKMEIAVVHLSQSRSGIRIWHMHPQLPPICAAEAEEVVTLTPPVEAQEEEEEIPITPRAERRPSKGETSVPQSPFGWAAELGEGLFGKFKQRSGEQKEGGSWF